jgi:cytochrome oxidase Cu insertion factor (SCO1/SenC/PrrC family)
MPLARRDFARAALVALVSTSGLAAALTLGSGCRLRSRGTPAAQAAIAPDFALPDENGKSHALADLRAKGPVVLVFYRGHW